MEKAAKTSLACLDLTSLGESDTTEIINSLCEQAFTPYGNVAALCVYPKFVAQVKQFLKSKGDDQIKVATVVNFPSGLEKLRDVVDMTEKCVNDGADEIDLVLNYTSIYAHFEPSDEHPKELEASQVAFIKAVKDACKNAHLKVIIESGFLEENLEKESAKKAIQFAAKVAIDAGADFVKTSTGKVTTNATEFGTGNIMKVIANHKAETGTIVGFKAAGGIRDVATAAKFLDIAKEAMGEEYLASPTFRFGASSLLKDILIHLGN